MQEKGKVARRIDQSGLNTTKESGKKFANEETIAAGTDIYIEVAALDLDNVSIEAGFEGRIVAL